MEGKIIGSFTFCRFGRCVTDVLLHEKNTPQNIKSKIHDNFAFNVCDADISCCLHIYNNK